MPCGSGNFLYFLRRQGYADIIGYAGRYDRCMFVIYDLGFIRDVAQFSRDIEENPNVHVLIIKK